MKNLRLFSLLAILSVTLVVIVGYSLKDGSIFKSDVTQAPSVTSFVKECENDKSDKIAEFERKVKQAKTSQLKRILQQEIEELKKFRCDCFETNSETLQKIKNLEEDMKKVSSSSEFDELRGKIRFLLNTGIEKPCPPLTYDNKPEYKDSFGKQMKEIESLKEKHVKECNVYISQLTSFFNEYLNAKRQITKNTIRADIFALFSQLEKSSCPDCSRARTLYDLNKQFITEIEDIDASNKRAGKNQDIANLVAKGEIGFQNKKLKEVIDQCVKDRSSQSSEVKEKVKEEDKDEEKINEPRVSDRPDVAPVEPQVLEKPKLDENISVFDSRSDQLPDEKEEKSDELVEGKTDR